MTHNNTYKVFEYIIARFKKEGSEFFEQQSIISESLCIPLPTIKYAIRYWKDRGEIETKAVRNKKQRGTIFLNKVKYSNSTDYTDCNINNNSTLVSSYNQSLTSDEFFLLLKKVGIKHPEKLTSEETYRYLLQQLAMDTLLEENIWHVTSYSKNNTKAIYKALCVVMNVKFGDKTLQGMYGYKVLTKIYKTTEEFYEKILKRLKGWIKTIKEFIKTASQLAIKPFQTITKKMIKTKDALYLGRIGQLYGFDKIYNEQLFLRNKVHTNEVILMLKKKKCIGKDWQKLLIYALRNTYIGNDERIYHKNTRTVFTFNPTSPTNQQKEEIASVSLKNPNKELDVNSGMGERVLGLLQHEYSSNLQELILSNEPYQSTDKEYNAWDRTISRLRGDLGDYINQFNFVKYNLKVKDHSAILCK